LDRVGVPAAAPQAGDAFVYGSVLGAY